MGEKNVKLDHEIFAGVVGRDRQIVKCSIKIVRPDIARRRGRL